MFGKIKTKIPFSVKIHSCMVGLTVCIILKKRFDYFSFSNQLKRNLSSSTTVPFINFTSWSVSDFSSVGLHRPLSNCNYTVSTAAALLLTFVRFYSWPHHTPAFAHTYSGTAGPTCHWLTNIGPDNS